MSQYTTQYKIILLGELSVGKSSILSSFVNNTFSETSVSTITDYLEKEIEIKGEPMKFQIWDTAGQEKYRSLVKIIIQDV